MRTQLIKDFEEFKSMRSAWNQLLTKSESDMFFLRHEWLTGWWELYGMGHKMHVILIWDKEELIAAAPLMIKRHKLMFRSIRFIAHGVSDYMDFIIAREREKCFNLIFKELYATRRGWDMLDLFFIRQDSPNYNLFKAYIGVRSTGIGKESIIDSSVIIELDRFSGWEEYFNKITKKYRDDIRRRENQLQKMGNLSYEKAKTKIEAEEMLLGLFNCHRNRWNEISQKSQFEDERLIKRYQRLVELMFDEGIIDISALSLNGKRIAFHWGYKYNGIFYYYTPSFSSEYANGSPGKILLKYLVKEAFENNYRRFDFLRGAEKYKTIWSREKMILSEFRLARYSLLGIVSFLVLLIMDDCIAKIKYNLKNSVYGRRIIKRIGIKI